jgi:hypothetical protein
MQVVLSFGRCVLNDGPLAHNRRGEDGLAQNRGHSIRPPVPQIQPRKLREWGNSFSSNVNCEEAKFLNDLTFIACSTVARHPITALLSHRPHSTHAP